MEKQLESICSQFCENTKRPELYLTIQSDHAKTLRRSTKALYDVMKCGEVQGQATDALPELIIDNFDDEQVWQELELQNEPVISGLLSSISKLVVTPGVSLTNYSSLKHKKKVKRKKDDGNHVTAAADDVEMAGLPSDDLGGELQHSGDDDGTDDDDDISGLMKNLRGSSAGYNSDDSEEERVLKQLLEKEHVGDGLASDNEGFTDDDLNDIENSDSDDNSESDLNKLSQELEKRENAFAFGKKSKDKTKIGFNVSGKRKKTVVDDNFFRLEDMESFLEQEDRKEERDMDEGNRSDDMDSGSDDTDDDTTQYGALYEDLPSSGDEQQMAASDVKYMDFFDDPDGDKTAHGADKADDGEMSSGAHKTAGGDDLSSGSDKDMPDESSGDSSEDEAKVSKGHDLLRDSESEGEEVKDILGGASSTYEKRRQRLKKRINDMEEAAIDEKPWQLKGEVAAVDRPLNSLLEETLDADQQTRTAPVITEETTKSLEEIIKQRIKDKAFDDVERKDKPKEEIFEYRKRIALDQEKSKLSLGQVYEQEFLKQQREDEEEKVDPQREEIRKMMSSLFLKLDALSNFHYTPKPSAPEVRIVSNLPTVSMEEVLPVAVSDKTMLAPEEIKDKSKQETKGETERSKTDKQRERKDKKRRQKQRKQDKEERQKLLEKIAPGLGNKYSKEKAMKELEKQSKTGKHVAVIEDKKGKKQKNLTSSTQFFTQLQEEASAHVESHRSKRTKNMKKKGQTAAKLKL